MREHIEVALPALRVALFSESARAVPAAVSAPELTVVPWHRGLTDGGGVAGLWTDHRLGPGILLLATPNAVASAASSVRSPRTISSSGRIATGSKKWKVMVLEQGRFIAEAPVQEDGAWRVTHALDWRPSTYEVGFVAVFSAIHPAAVLLTLCVHGIPEGNWLHTLLSSRGPCSGACNHYPAMPTW